MAPKPKRAKNKDNARRSKKKVSILSSEAVDYVDFKDVNLLRRFGQQRPAAGHHRHGDQERP